VPHLAPKHCHRYMCECEDLYLMMVQRSMVCSLTLQRCGKDTTVAQAKFILNNSSRGSRLDNSVGVSDGVGVNSLRKRRVGSSVPFELFFYKEAI